MDQCINLEDGYYAIYSQKDEAYDVYSKDDKHLGTALSLDEAELIAAEN